MSRTFLVTGGAGFIGSAIAQSLVKQGDIVVVADNLSTGYRENIPNSCQFVEMDVSVRKHYSRLPDIAFDAIFHLAAQSSGEASFSDPWIDFNSHAVATFLLLEYCRLKGIRRFLYASSMSIYGDPDCLPVDEDQPTRPKTYYAAGKLAAETYVNLHATLGMATTIFRMFSVYGPNQNLANKMQGMVSIYLSYLLEHQPIVVKGSSERFRDFVYIDDVVDAWLSVLDNPMTFSKTYNLGTGVKTTVGQLLHAMKSSAREPNFPIEYANNTPGDQFGMFADVTALKVDTGWFPRHDLCDGLAKMIGFHRRIGSSQ